MSCRRVSRELLERFRFGEELDRRSEPHLAHLQSCGTCREEVGLDRALVLQLRRALRARVGDGTPPGGSWEAVRARALEAPSGRPLGALLIRWVRLFPAAVAVTVMAIAVGVPHSAPAAPLQERSWVLTQQLPPSGEWVPPWYIRYRPVTPIEPSRGGPLASDFTEPVDPDPPRASGLIE
jgi:anti-sigma factor RsiW